MNLSPLDDRILVRRDDAKDSTSGGILLPDNAKPRPRRGTVLAVGPGARFEYGRTPVNLEPDDMIFFTSYAGEEIECNGEKLVIMREADVLAVVT